MSKRISKKRLEEIVLEEFAKLRLVEANPSHDAKGRFTQRGKAGSVYSLTKNAEEEIGNSKDLKVQRGIETASGNVSSKFGMNTGSPKKQCGRKTIDGAEKPITRSCKEYPKNYWASMEELLLDESADGDICNRCIQSFLARIRQANAALKAARDGKTKNA
tara:strand:+ start:815 stop:1297 length:483 start_codon:yes stop_codon:yes gene_type:complete